MFFVHPRNGKEIKDFFHFVSCRVQGAGCRVQVCVGLEQSVGSSAACPDLSGVVNRGEWFKGASCRLQVASFPSSLPNCKLSGSTGCKLQTPERG